MCVCVVGGSPGVNKGGPHRAPGPGVPGGPVTEVMDDVFTAREPQNGLAGAAGKRWSDHTRLYFPAKR